MNEANPRALLPAGLRDLLPPEAEHEARTVEALLTVFAAHGYERVKPPLVEFEEGLVGGEAASDAGQAFRLMDPVSQRMMGVRADITVQVARIATTRLRNAPRPVRLCYAGDVLRVKSTQLTPDRQFCQVGVELIGAAQAAAGDAEVVLIAAEALNAVGVSALSIDLNLPTLVPAICDALPVPPRAVQRLRAALDRKDATAVAAIESEIDGTAGRNGLFAALLAASGPARRALDALDRLDLPAAARGEAQRLAEVVQLILAAQPETRLTVDPVENRGFEYHTGVTFTIFADHVRGELGRGGRYVARPGLAPPETGDEGEPATGFTLFMNTLRRGIADPEPRARVFVPLEVPGEEAGRLRADGWVTVRGLMPADDERAEAKRMGCSHVYSDGAMHEIT